MRQRVDAFFARLEDIVRTRVTDYQLAIDPYLTPRFLVGMAIGVAANANWMFPTDATPTREQLGAELTKIATWGFAGRPGTTPFGRTDGPPGQELRGP
jgi:hypothetical protein